MAAAEEKPKADAKADAKASADEAAKKAEEKAAKKAAKKEEREKKRAARLVAKRRRQKDWNRPMSRDGTYIFVVKLVIFMSIFAYILFVMVFFSNTKTHP